MSRAVKNRAGGISTRSTALMGNGTGDGRIWPPPGRPTTACSRSWMFCIRFAGQARRFCTRTRSAAVTEQTEVDRGEPQSVDDEVERRDRTVRHALEVGAQSELVDEIDGGRMDGVPSKIAEEIRMLLEHDHIDASPREQESQHHPGRTAARDDTLRR
jgi:hypothetical protein